MFWNVWGGGTFLCSPTLPTLCPAGDEERKTTHSGSPLLQKQSYVSLLVHSLIDSAQCVGALFEAYYLFRQWISKLPQVRRVN